MSRGSGGIWAIGAKKTLLTGLVDPLLHQQFVVFRDGPRSGKRRVYILIHQLEFKAGRLTDKLDCTLWILDPRKLYQDHCQFASQRLGALAQDPAFPPQPPVHGVSAAESLKRAPRGVDPVDVAGGVTHPERAVRRDGAGGDVRGERRD